MDTGSPTRPTGPRDTGAAVPDSSDDRRPGVLDALADRNGIEHEFRDAHGKVRCTPAGTKLALLTAMGVEAGDEAAASEAPACLVAEDSAAATALVRA